MFSKMCHKFVEEYGKNTLIPSPSPDEANNIKPLNVVTKWYKRHLITKDIIVYETHAFQLRQLLTDKTEFNSKPLEKPDGTFSFEHVNSASVSFAKYILSYFLPSISAKSKFTSSVNLKTHTKEEVPSQDDFLNELTARKLNLNHTLVGQIRKLENRVLCVILGVRKTAQDAEIECKDEKGCKLIVKSSEEAVTNYGIEVNAKIHNVKENEILLKKDTTLAYKIWELKITTNNENDTEGKIEPMMFSQLTGGFKQSQMDAVDGSSISQPEKGETSVFQHLEDQLQPLRDLDKTDRQSLKASLLKLMACHTDVVILSKLLEQAVSDNMPEKPNKKIVNSNAISMITSVAGIKQEGDAGVYDMDRRSIRAAVAYLVDAMCVVDAKVLEKIGLCKEEQFKGLEKIFRSAVSSENTMPISYNKETSSKLEKHAEDILTDMNFEIIKDSNTIFPPRSDLKTEIHDCMYCILYSLVSLS